MTTTVIEAQITHMRNGKTRAECSCGWWEDHKHPGRASLAAIAHRCGRATTQGCIECRLWIAQHHPSDYANAESYINSARSHHYRHEHGSRNAS